MMTLHLHDRQIPTQKRNYPCYTVLGDSGCSLQKYHRNSNDTIIKHISMVFKKCFP